MHGRESLLNLLGRWGRRGGPIPRPELADALAALDLSRADLADTLSFDERSYRRVILDEGAHFQALVLCWRSGQRSPIHDHAGSSCAVKVVQGRATETRFGSSPCGLLVPLESETIEAGTVATCGGGCIHQLANLGPPGEDLVTLHIYSPRPAAWRYYRLGETTMRDHDALLEHPARTIRVDFGHTSRQVTPNRGRVAASAAIGPARAVAIVGAGFSGTMVAVHLARAPGANPSKILVFDKRGRFARGPAYETGCDGHLLNVPAGLMSAFPDEPAHFLDWLRARDPSAHAGTFARRKVYGDYLEELLQGAAGGGRIELIGDEVVDADLGGPGGGEVTLRTARGETFGADRVVLALGNPPPREPEATGPVAACRGYIADPWRPGALAGLGPDESIALIGTGLTAVDQVVGAIARGHRGKIVAISRHGLLPNRHQPCVPRPHFDFGDVPRTAGAIFKAVRGEVASCRAEGGDWRSVVDGVRPAVQGLWRSLGDGERGRFVRHLAARWDVHRHRVAPEVDDKVRDALGRGTLEIIAGRVRAMTPDGSGIAIEFVRRGQTRPESLRVDRAINCTGPCWDLRVAAPPVLRNLLTRGRAHPGPLDMGLKVAESGALIAADGRADGRFFAIGPLLKGLLWETTAVRELREQAQRLARTLIG